jgi:hypothetical protein
LVVEPWRRGIVAIASSSGTEDPGFESRQGVRFLGFLYIAYINMHCNGVDVFEKNKCLKIIKQVFDGGF